jgi:hypothetical protein
MPARVAHTCTTEPLKGALVAYACFCILLWRVDRGGVGVHDRDNRGEGVFHCGIHLTSCPALYLYM